MLAVLGVFAAIFVVGDVLEAHFFPGLPMGWHHAYLTLRASVAAAVAVMMVYVVMRGQERAISKTAAQLSNLLESCKADALTPHRFENPHLVHCREILQCRRTDCPMYDSPGKRCWQIKALSDDNGSGGGPAVSLQRCHECEVYRTACPDRLTQLGESFNNLMYLLERESRRSDRMRARMLEGERMAAIGQMAAGFAHEVGNPLSSISAIVQLLRRRHDGEVKPEQLALIDTHIQRISMIVRQLVSLARPGARLWETLDIGKTIEEAVRLARHDEQARRVAVSCEISPTLPPTYGLRGPLQQVFLNLALNAFDAMPEGGRLTIKAQEVNRQIEITVADSGSGISAAFGRRVFEPFFTTKDPGRGMGLGLSVSYGIIREHGGTIDFESTAGQGTKFVIRLPVLDEAPQA